jgi:tetratricopeptide (TPR) repeat protein
VDEHLVLAPSAQLEALSAAVKAAGVPTERLRWLVYEWPGSYGQARTAALRWAEEDGASWAMTLDTDERVDLQRGDLERELNDPGNARFLAFCVSDRDLLYQKPRFLRCGAGLEWRGGCAERLLGADGKPPEMAHILGEFWELPKTDAQERARAERGIREMQAQLEAGSDAHARRHLGECLMIVGRMYEARECFECVALASEDEAPLFERTWCRYRLAEMDCVDGHYGAALLRAGGALAEDPGLIQELGWVMAHASAQLGRMTAAALWCSYVLAAPIDYSRGGQRGRTWRDGARELLSAIEAAAARRGKV